MPPLISSHPLKHEPEPGTLAKIAAERNFFRRALKAALDGNRRMAWAADQCARMNMTKPEDAIKHLREVHFRGFFRDVPLTPIERDMVRQGTAFCTLLAYRIVVKSIERELIAARADARRSVEATAT